MATRFDVPLTIIRICSTYGPEGGAPADRLDRMLRGTADPVATRTRRTTSTRSTRTTTSSWAIRAMEVAALPPITVNWGGSETVSAEEYCAYMGELVGVEP